MVGQNSPATAHRRASSAMRSWQLGEDDCSSSTSQSIHCLSALQYTKTEDETWLISYMFSCMCLYTAHAPSHIQPI